MIDTQALEEIASRLSHALPPGLGQVRDELETNFRAILQSQLPRLELVGREEFEATRDMLAATRHQVAALEEQIRTLETRLAE